MNRLIVLAALVGVLGWVGLANAQCCCGATTAYYAPQTAYYAAPATTAYYAPAPRTVYYAAPRRTVYYAAPVTTSYYAPQTAYYAPAPIVQTRYRPILGGSVTRVYYPW